MSQFDYAPSSSNDLPAKLPVNEVVYADNLLQSLAALDTPEAQQLLHRSEVARAEFLQELRVPGRLKVGDEAKSEWREFLATQAGAETIRHLNVTILSLLEEWPIHGLPGRGIDNVSKVIPALTFRWILDNTEVEFASLACAPLLLHQLGATFESLVNKGRLGEEGEAALSYYVAKEILSSYPQLPVSLVEHMLLAVAESGSFSSRSQSEFSDSVLMVGALSVLGVEGIARQIAYELGSGNFELDLSNLESVSHPSQLMSSGRVSWIHHMNLVMREAGRGFEHRAHPRLSESRLIMGQFLYQALPIDTASDLFSQEIAIKRGKSPLLHRSSRPLESEIAKVVVGELSRETIKNIRGRLKGRNSLQAAADLSDIGQNNGSVKIWSHIKAEIDAVTSDDDDSLNLALGYALFRRDGIQARLNAQIANTLDSEPKNSVLYQLASFLKRRR